VVYAQAKTPLYSYRHFREENQAFSLGAGLYDKRMNEFLPRTQQFYIYYFLLFNHEPTRTKLTFASIFYPKTSNFIIIQGFRRLSDYFKQQVRGG